MLRRHFFLVGALTVLLIMVIAGGLKLATGTGKGGQGGGGAGAPMAKGPPGGGPGGPPGGGRRGGGGFGGPAQVSAVAVAPRTFIDAIEVLGVAKGRQSVTLSAAATQLIDKVHFRDGQAVRQGAVLVELKDTEQDAGLAQAEARLVEAKRAYDRFKTLGEKGFASKASIDQYEAAYLSAQADVSAARARKGDRRIRAPFSGVVGLSNIAPGALVNPGAAIVTLDDVSAVRVDFQVPDRYLSSLREGQAIFAKTDAYPGQTINGRIAKLDTRVDERTRSITARAEFPNPDRRLKPGMMLRVSIAQGQRQSPAAPESAVSVQGDNAFVYVLTRQGERMVADQRPVVTGDRQQGFVELREGVKPGEQIVADGLNKIQNGQPVMLAGQGRPGGPGAARPGGGRPSAEASAGARPNGPRPPA